jgi:dGTPase
MIHEIVRRMINSLVSDLIATSRAKIDHYQPADIDAVRSLSVPLIGLGKDILGMHTELKQFLRKNLYQHERVQQMTGKAKQTIKTLFEIYMADTGLLPKDVQLRLNKEEDNTGASGQARVIADYIAGMTDRFAIAELERIS